ncbi:MAG: protease inhibitor I42 family protein [Candidatus Promineofilum sp.]|nr:protease inhibitor I42 family protein [Promineifilum sp.]
MPNGPHRPRLLLVFALLFLLLPAACGGATADPENVFIADEDDSGQTVTMVVGDALQLMLQENPTTGYVWSVATNDEGVLASSAEPSYEVDSDAIGAGGVKTFMFRAAAPGTSVLRLVNARAQETAVEPSRVFEITVQVVD